MHSAEVHIRYHFRSHLGLSDDTAADAQLANVRARPQQYVGTTLFGHLATLLLGGAPATMGQAQMPTATAATPAGATVHASTFAPDAAEKPKTTRTAFQIAAGRRAPDGLPQGTESCVESLDSAMQLYAVGRAAVPINEGGGGFSTYKFGQIEPTIVKAAGCSHGFIQRFACSQCSLLLKQAKKAAGGPRAWDATKYAESIGLDFGGRKVQDKDLIWMVHFEKADDGKFYFNEGQTARHFSDHELSTDPDAMHSHARHQVHCPRRIHGGCGGVVQVRRYGGRHPSEARQRADEERKLVTWTYGHLYDRLRDRRLMLKEDGKGYAKLLEARNAEGLPTEYRVNDALEMSCSFVLQKRYDEIWATGTRVLLFDPIARANRYGHQLSAFTTIDYNGVTQMLGYVSLEDKEGISYDWALKCVAKYLRFAPRMVASDQETAIVNALRKLCTAGQAWAECPLLLLCIFHIWKLFYQRIHGLFVNNADAWRLVSNTFWRTVKRSDSRSVGKWEDEWKHLVELVRTTKTMREGKSGEALEWLTKLGAEPRTFAYRFTWQHFAGCCNSTQRSEAQNSSLRNVGVKGSLTLVQMAEKVIRLGESTQSKSTTTAVQQGKQNDKALQQSSNPWLKSLSGKLTPFGLKKTLESYHKADGYTVAKQRTGGYLVQHMGSAALRQAGGPAAPVCDVEGDITIQPEELCNVCDFDFDGRLVTLSDDGETLKCTCQYQTHSGVPCPHMFVTWNALGRYPVDLRRAFHSVWLMQNSTSVAKRRLVLALHQTPLPVGPRLGAEDAPKGATADDRERALMLRARPLAELARKDDQAFHRLCMQFDNLMSHFGRGQPLRFVTESESDSDLDKQRIAHALGHAWDLDECPDEAALHGADRASLVGHIVVIKWAARWYLARVKVQAMASAKAVRFKGRDYQPNFVLTYFTDGDREGDTLLHEHNYYAHDQPSDFATWALLKEAPLSSAVSAEHVRDPGQKVAAGRPGTSRLKPVSGPTSAARPKDKAGQKASGVGKPAAASSSARAKDGGNPKRSTGGSGTDTSGGKKKAKS